MARELRNIFRGLRNVEVVKSPPMKTLTTIGTGGRARALVCPADLTGLKEALKGLVREGVGYFVIGRGSNILVPDEGTGKVALGIRNHMEEIQFNGNGVTVEGGASLPRLAALCAIGGKSGLEEISGIPGTVGGAVLMNAGSYGREIGALVGWVEVVDESGKVHRLDGSQVTFRYRKTHLPVRGVIYRARLELADGKSDHIFARMREVNGIRRRAQPWGEKTFGSAFKNPPGMAAGKMIEEAGLKGRRIGDAVVSEKHANFIVNRGKARTRDVVRLMEEVKRVVREKRGVTLEPEVEYLG